jgi:TetR/AcrR family transcriptional regulator, repressor for divergent bdcA
VTGTEITPTRGRPRKFDLDNGVATALSLFARHGYDAVGVGEICGAVGITPTSLYAAYASKFNLFQLTIDRYVAQSGLFVGKALAAATTPQDLWPHLLFAAAEQYSQGESKGCPVLDGFLATREPDVQTLLARQTAATRTAIAARLAALGDSNADTNAEALLTIMRGLSAAARSGMSQADMHATVKAILAAHGRPA